MSLLFYAFLCFAKSSLAGRDANVHLLPAASVARFKLSPMCNRSSSKVETDLDTYNFCSTPLRPQERKHLVACLSLLLYTVARFWPLRLVWRYRMRLGARWRCKPTWIEEFACQGHWGKLLQQEEHTQVTRSASFLACTIEYTMLTIVFSQYDIERWHKVHILSCTTWAKGFFEKMCQARQRDGQDACRCVPCHFAGARGRFIMTVELTLWSYISQQCSVYLSKHYFERVTYLRSATTARSCGSLAK